MKIEKLQFKEYKSILIGNRKSCIELLIDDPFYGFALFPERKIDYELGYKLDFYVRKLTDLYFPTLLINFLKKKENKTEAKNEN